MKRSAEFSCPDCGMVFRSFGLLDKHKSRFCIGRSAGDPDGSRRGRAESGEPKKEGLKTFRPRVTKTPDLIRLREQKDKLLSETRETRGEPCVSDSPAFNKLTHEGSYPSRKWADGERRQEVCEHHERKLAEIRAHTSELEQQRREIERRIALIGRDGTTDLKEQEERNEEVLYRLNTQISALQGEKDADAPPDPLQDRRPHHTPFDLISSVDGPLSRQIGSLHLAYVQSGGSDPEVLFQLQDLHAEARTVEQSRTAAERRTRKTRRTKWSGAALDVSIMAVEHENQQLEEQILKMQIDRERHRGRAAGLEHTLIQRHHVRQLSSLQTEVSNLKREVERSRETQKNPPAPVYRSQQHPVMDTHTHVFDSENPLGPAPYDPVSGFVIFYDMVVGVDASVRTLHLVAWLFSEGQELGQPIPMPPVRCQPAGALGYPARRHAENYALLAVQQPVHRVQPSPSLYLVVEVQGVDGLGLCDQETRGWSKLQLFDDCHQVQSGFWKLPFRSPPVRPTLSSAQLNSVPQLGNMEICLRVANARDGDVQTLATIEPNNSKRYKYPSMVISHSDTDVERQASQLKTSKLVSNPFLSSSTQTDHVDPPPKGGGQM